MVAPFARLPSLTIAKGKPVTVVEGVFDTVRDEDGIALRPADVLALLLRDQQPIVLVDADGVAADRPQLDLVRTLSEQAGDAGTELWVDCGPRSLEGVFDVVMAGGSSAILSTRTLASGTLLADAARSCDRLILSVDIGEGLEVCAADPALRRPPAELLRQAATLHLQAAILNRASAPPWDGALLAAALGPPPPIETYLAGPGSSVLLKQAAAAGMAGWVASLLEVLEAVPEER